MKKFTLAVIIIGTFILFSLFSLFYNHTNTLALPPNSSADPGVSATPVPTSTVPAASGTAGPPNATSTTNALYKDGAYTGSVADAQWGNIQVRAVIQKGRITNISFLQYPNERDRSVMINSYADPQLSSEAIQAQNATVDIVTGATDSSEAFMQSLSDALSQANA
jgi:uncharacterized protein with FMN-binding domain